MIDADADGPQLVTLSSDFGSPYPAAMRGVVLSQCDARLVDVSHEFPRGDVTAAAFWLRDLLPSMPPAVHLVVIDPGVGTDRDVLAIEAGDHRLVGPDNGVLVPAARELGDTSTAYRLPDYDATSETFHGRDVFAPLAATVYDHGSAELSTLDPLEPMDDITTISFPTPTIGDETLVGTVLVVDDFGTAITSIPGSAIESAMGSTVAVDGQVVPVEPSYAHVDSGAPLVTVGSHDHLELAVNDGRGVDAFDVAPGDRIRIELDGTG